ncbi:ABC transporter ATP-binding protein [Castellaniella sp.]|uniref:ABC transporter ATP-binding protein n=1 Tax=Castellaniella sp. TaxID=1955812 RepID=UPI0035677E31
MLKVEGISVKYGLLEAVSSVSIHVKKGQIVSLIGANGAGKSTTLKSIIGILPLAKGRILYEGVDITHTKSHERVAKGIVLCPEGRRLFPRMTVYENLLTGAHLHNDLQIRKENLEYLYGLFPRVADRRKQVAGSLSGGEQQMVAIGRALMSSPRLLMLDEPSLGLAPKIIKEIEQAIMKIVEVKKTSVLLVEQNANLALHMSDFAYVLEKGEIIRDGTGKDLANNEEIKKIYLGI